MTLTTEQLESLSRGEAIDLLVNDREYALLKRDTYEAMRAIIDEMIEDGDPRVMRGITARMFARYDQEDAVAESA